MAGGKREARPPQHHGRRAGQERHGIGIVYRSSRFTLAGERSNVKRMAAHAGRRSEPLAAGLPDLDQFKQVNDTCGHGRGDDVLAALGAVPRDELRESDFAGRMGRQDAVVRTVQLAPPSVDRFTVPSASAA